MNEMKYAEILRTGLGRCTIASFILIFTRFHPDQARQSKSGTVQRIRSNKSHPPGTCRACRGVLKSRRILLVFYVDYVPMLGLIYPAPSCLLASHALVWLVFTGLGSRLASQSCYTNNLRRHYGTFHFHSAATGPKPSMGFHPWRVRATTIGFVI